MRQAHVMAPQLFRLDKDPLEQQNIAGLHPEVVQRMMRKIEGWYPVQKTVVGR